MKSNSNKILYTVLAYILLLALPAYALSISLSSLIHALFILTSLIIVIVNPEDTLKFNWFVIVLFILIGFIVISMFFSINNPAATIKSSMVYIVNLVTAILFYWVLRGIHDQKFQYVQLFKIMKHAPYFAGSALFVSGLYCFYNFISSYPYLKRNGGFIGIIVSAAVAFLVLSWVLLYLSFCVNSKTKKFFLRLGTFGGFMGIIGTGTRVSLILFVLGILVILLMTLKIKYAYKLLFIFIFILLVSSLFLFWEDAYFISRLKEIPKALVSYAQYLNPWFEIKPMDKTIEPYIRNPNRSRYWVKEKNMHGQDFISGNLIRPVLWKITFMKIREKPLFGHGVGSWYTMMYRKTTVAYDYINYNPKHQFTHPHNDMILYAFEIGIPYVITNLLLLIVLGIRFLAVILGKKIPSYSIILFILLATYFLSSMSDVITFNVKISGVFFCLLAYLAHLGEYVKNKKKNDANLFYITL